MELTKTQQDFILDILETIEAFCDDPEIRWCDLSEGEINSTEYCTSGFTDLAYDKAVLLTKKLEEKGLLTIMVEVDEETLVFPTQCEISFFYDGTLAQVTLYGKDFEEA